MHHFLVVVRRCLHCVVANDGLIFCLVRVSIVEKQLEIWYPISFFTMVAWWHLGQCFCWLVEKVTTWVTFCHKTFACYSLPQHLTGTDLTQNYAAFNNMLICLIVKSPDVNSRKARSRRNTK